MNLEEVKRNWEKFAQMDPFFAILTDPSKRGGKWNVKEFFDSGVKEVEGIINTIDSLGLSLHYGRALDFGCGVGRLTQPLGARFKEAIGVDISSNMVNLAMKFNTLPNCKFIVNARADLSLFPDNYFDFILSLITLQHMEPRYIRGYLLEFARVLSHGGVGCLGIPDNTNGPKAQIHLWVQSNRFGYLVYKNLPRRAMPVMEMHGLTRSEVTSLMNSGGL